MDLGPIFRQTQRKSRAPKWADFAYRIKKILTFKWIESKQTCAVCEIEAILFEKKLNRDVDISFQG